MTAVLLSAHVLAAIILIGPITVAASVFPRYARSAGAADDPRTAPALPVAAAMHRISRGYAVPALAVPVLGIGVGASMGVLTDAWLLVSMALTAIAAVLLVWRVVPTQARVLDGLRAGGEGTALGREVRRLSMTTGLFALLWAVVVVLMVVRPGSSTGA